MAAKEVPVAKNALGLRHHAAMPPRPGQLPDPRAKARRSTASRAARTVAIVGVLALAGTTWALWDHASAPTAATPSPTARISLAPNPPLPIWWESLTGPQYTVVTARRGQPVRVGVHLDGRGGNFGSNYVVSQVLIDVLPIGVHPYESVTVKGKPPEPGRPFKTDNPGGGRLEQGTKPSVRRLWLKNLPSSTNRDVTVLFDGTDAKGRPLPAGRYEVGFFIATKLTKAYGTEPAGSSNGLSGLLVTVNYLG
jgi:hypothetical protein